MKNFTQKFIGIFALVFAMSFNVNSQEINGQQSGTIHIPEGWSLISFNLNLSSGDEAYIGDFMSDGLQGCGNFIAQNQSGGFMW